MSRASSRLVVIRHGESRAQVAESFSGHDDVHGAVRPRSRQAVQHAFERSRRSGRARRARVVHEHPAASIETAAIIARARRTRPQPMRLVRDPRRRCRRAYAAPTPRASTRSRCVEPGRRRSGQRCRSSDDVGRSLRAGRRSARRIADEHPGETVVVVGHGGTVGASFVALGDFRSASGTGVHARGVDTSITAVALARARVAARRASTTPRRPGSTGSSRLDGSGARRRRRSRRTASAPACSASRSISSCSPSRSASPSTSAASASIASPAAARSGAGRRPSVVGRRDDAEVHERELPDPERVVDDHVVDRRGREPRRAPRAAPRSPRAWAAARRAPGPPSTGPSVPGPAVRGRFAGFAALQVSRVCSRSLSSRVDNRGKWDATQSATIRWSPHPAGPTSRSLHVGSVARQPDDVRRDGGRFPKLRRRFRVGGPTTRGDAAIATDDTRINDRIRARQVRLIGSDGTQFGVKTLPDALQIAREQGLDLVEVAANADPPVCKIMDYGKYKYEQDQRRKESRSARRRTSSSRR